MSKRVSIYGSTGSIGTQALEVVEKDKNLEITTLVANSDGVVLLAEQALMFRPKHVAIIDKSKADILTRALRGTGINVLAGKEDAMKACSDKDTDIVLNSAVGFEGLEPTIKFIMAGKDIALANKESIVTGGHLVMQLARDYKVRLLPVDSEHSAVFQILNCGRDLMANTIGRIILTASGGPFRGKQREELEDVTPEEALNHPTWKMGDRITIDCATLMNKGFEVIEAKWLFNVTADQIGVFVHPQSIVHAIVEYADGVQISHMSLPSMKFPIQYALNYPVRLENDYSKLNLPAAGTLGRKGVLEFMEPDTETFGCLKLAYDVARSEGLDGAVLNGADEVAVRLFLARKIRFLEIEEIVGEALTESRKVLKYEPRKLLRPEVYDPFNELNPSKKAGALLRSGTYDPSAELMAIKEADEWARSFVADYVKDKAPVRQKSKVGVSR